MLHSNIDCLFCGARLDGTESLCPTCRKNAPALRCFRFEVIEGASSSSAQPSEAIEGGDIIITTRDHFVLDEIACLRMRSGDAAARILIEKLKCSKIVSPEDVPADVITLGSRVVFSVDGGDAEARVLTHPDAHSVSAWSLPITAPRGAALLGLRAGAVTNAPRLRGGMERIDILSVIGRSENGMHRHGMRSVSCGGRALSTPRRGRGYLQQDDDPLPPAA